MTFLVGLLVAVLVIGVAAAGFGWWTVNRSFPTTSGQLEVAGLSDSVRVTRDANGIPTIVAENDHDLFLAQGFVHAQDRFWEMDFRRHVTAGRLAELFGDSQVGTDAFIRTLDWHGVAEAEYAALDETTRGYYDAYAEGVNAYLAQRQGADLSLEYGVLALQNPGYSPEPWHAVDSVAWLKAMAWDLRSNLEDEIDRALLATALPPEEVARLHPGYAFDRMPTIMGGMPAGAAPTAAPAGAADPGDDAERSDASAYAAAAANLRATLDGIPELIGPAGNEIGSNSWVVSGALTDTGAPLLANDPHLGATMPSVWTQQGLSCSTVDEDCGFDVAGYTFAGLPGVIIGHNQRIAWGFTNLGPDVADLYLERIEGDTYELDGTMQPLTLREEVIEVAGGEPRTITVRSTARGPIVTDIEPAFTEIAADYPAAAGVEGAAVEGADLQLSLQWTALTPGTTAAAIFTLDRAQTWEEFRLAASQFDVPAQNLVYADVDGNIGYQAPGSIPIRAAGDGTVPLPGWTNANGWTGTVPFEALPSEFNPARGYIVTANNAVSGTGPFLTADWDLGYRAQAIERRIQALLSAGEPITAADLADIQLDTADANAEAFLPIIAELALDGDAAQGQSLLADWDGRADLDSAEAAYFAVFWRNLLAGMFGGLPEATRPAGGDRWYSVVGTLLGEPDSPWWADPGSGASGRDAVIGAALDAAWAESAERMGDDPGRWRWGRLHTLTLTNQSFGESGIAPIEWLFNRGPYPLPGGSSIANANGWDASEGYEVHWVPSMRMVVDLADFDRSRWINLTGASGHAFHPNYADQTPLWQDGELLAWPFTRDAVEAAAAATLVLRPAG
ncbi:penicillin acylase family protein [Agromyces sp. LHK192]|uniref:penicillin acylase family protein n=1 Tax=Agromyces sp. LHK192 TaxID=2498704 RepID=UPI001F0B72EB|nr:penicillin acylase family protein [Agromyces sp. LHK192]